MSRFARHEIIPRKLGIVKYCSLVAMWNKIRSLTCRRHISHLQSKYFTSKIFHSFHRNEFHWKSTCICKCFFLVETKRIARRTAVRRHARGLSDRPPDARNSASQNRPVRSSSKKITRTLQKQYSCYWWRRRGSNSRPYGCEPYALPAELRPHWFAMWL